MAVVQMQRMNLVAMKRNRKAILERLQEIGALEVNVKLKKTVKVKRQDTSAACSMFEKRSATADAALEILNKYAPEKTSLFDSLAGKPLADQSDYDETVANQQEYMEKAGDITAWEKQITEAKANIQKLENQLEALTPWMGLDIPMNTSGTDETVLFLGTVPEQATEEQILTALKSHNPPVDAADVEILSAGRDASCLSVLCLRQDGAAAEEALREIGFARPSWIIRRTPAQEQEAIRDQIKEYQIDIDNYIAKIADLAPYRQRLRLVSDYYRMRAEKYEVLGTLPQTAHTFAVSGYVPARQAQELAEEMRTQYGAAVEIEDLGPKEEAPVLLKNNAFSNSVEGVLSSYGLPKKGEVDPTFFMSIFYVALFGMMLSDAAYGAIIAAVCGFALLKFPRMDEGLRKSIKLFFWCGLSTIFWGIMFGSYFGDVVNVISRNYFGHEVTIKPLWFAPLDDPMRLLIYSLLFGIIHMFIGLGLKGYMMLKDRDIVGFVSDVLAWYLLLVGLILILLPTSIFESISNMTFSFPPFMQPLSIGMAAVGAVIILVMSGRRKKKKIGIRLAIGLYDLYGITSWLSDLLSYSRLLALGLATGVIAQVINQMGSMFGTGVFGTIVFIVVFLVGTVLNLAINLLGAYVHSNRLEFVEFFNKFYDGGGKPFEPFRVITKYVTFVHSKQS